MTNIPYLLLWKQMKSKNRSDNRCWCLMNVRCKKWFRSKMNVGIIMKSYFCEYIGISTYDKTFLQLFMWNKGTRKIRYNICRLIFILVSYKNVTLVYDHTYLKLLMLNNSKSRLIYENCNLVFIMINYTR